MTQTNLEAVMVDTDVVSILFKKGEEQSAYRELLHSHVLLLSFMGVAELYQWAYQRNWGAKRIALLESELSKYVLVPSSSHICQVWAQIRAEGFAKGRPIQPQDAFHAACARYLGVPLATNNFDDFKNVDHLEVLTVS